MTLGQTNRPTTKNITRILHHKHTFLKQGYANSHNSLGIAKKIALCSNASHQSHRPTAKLLFNIFKRFFLMTFTGYKLYCRNIN